MAEFASKGIAGTGLGLGALLVRLCLFLMVTAGALAAF